MNHPRPTAGKMVLAGLLIVAVVFAGVLLGASLSGYLYGQTTKVIPLEAADAKLAKDAYEAVKLAGERWEQVDRYVKKKYGSPKSENDLQGMEYSEDFRYLVKMGVGLLGGGTASGKIADCVTVDGSGALTSMLCGAVH